MAAIARKICFVTGSRADFGLLKFLIEDAAQRFAVQVVVTGSHLEPRLGETYREIEVDGVRIDARIPLQLGDDSELTVTRAMGRAVSGCGEVFATLKPDMV